MPFTLSHCIAVVPIARVLKRRCSLSALLAGCVAPDFRHIPQLPSFGIPSHSIAGVFTFCLPLGLLFYLAFHGIMKRPLIALLPNGWACRIETLESSRRRWPDVSALTVALCVVAGAFTHLIWDAFTHPGWVVDHISILQYRVFHLEGLHVPVFRILQHVSTVVGLVVLWRWLARWYREAPVGSVAASLPTRHRVLAIAAILSVTSVVALTFGAATIVGAGPILKLRAFLFGAALGSFCGLWSTLLAFSAWWYRFARSQDA